MMNDNFIIKNSSCISTETCQLLINFFNNNESLASRGHAGNVILEDLEIPINVFHFDKNLKNGIYNTIDKYKEKYPLINSVLARWGVNEVAQLMRYEPGDVYDMIHCETGVNNPYRIFAWMIYLNTIKDGGGTEFLHLNETLCPKEGDMYVWPAGWTHLHRGVVAPYERKYLLTGWVSHVL